MMTQEMNNHKMEIKEVLHFYLGVKCLTPEGVDELQAVYKNSGPCFFNIVKEYPVESIKPVLRPLNEITGEEEAALATQTLPYSGNPHSLDAHRTMWLCKNGFDVFDLHRQGLCVYRNVNGTLY